MFVKCSEGVASFATPPAVSSLPITRLFHFKRSIVMAGLFCIFIVMTALGGLAISYFDALNDCDDDAIRTLDYDSEWDVVIGIKRK